MRKEGEMAISWNCGCMCWRAYMSQQGVLVHTGMLAVVWMLPLAGRWKATPVAVKIIDHYSTRGDASSSSGHGNRMSAGREMLFATSIAHPNLVSFYADGTCFMSPVQRTADLAQAPGYIRPQQFHAPVRCAFHCLLYFQQLLFSF